MTIPPEINQLIERLNQEIDELEESTFNGLNLLRPFIERFPDNQTFIGMFAFLNSVIFAVELEKQRIRRIIETLSEGNEIDNHEVQLAGQDLSTKVGQLIETQISVNNIIQRLEDLL